MGKFDSLCTSVVILSGEGEGKDALVLVDPLADAVA